MRILKKIINKIKGKNPYDNATIKCEVSAETAFILEGLAGHHNQTLGCYLNDVVMGRLIPSGNHSLYFNLMPLVYKAMEGEYLCDYRYRFNRVFDFAKCFRGLQSYDLICLKEYFSTSSGLPMGEELTRHLEAVSKHVPLDFKVNGVLRSPQEIVNQISEHWIRLSSVPETYDLLNDLLVLDVKAKPMSLWTLLEYSNFVYRNRYK